MTEMWEFKPFAFTAHEVMQFSIYLPLNMAICVYLP